MTSLLKQPAARLSRPMSPKATREWCALNGTVVVGGYLRSTAERGAFAARPDSHPTSAIFGDLKLGTTNPEVAP